MVKTQRIILGLVGNPGSGKTTVGRYLTQQHKFYHFEGSDGLRERAQQQGALLITREDYSNFHRKLQKEFGKDVLAKTLLARPESRLVFVGIRSTANARLLQAAGGLIIALDCPSELRFERVDHSGLKYEKTLGAFKRAEEEEFYSPDGYGAEVMRVMGLADLTIDTSLPLEESRKVVDALIVKLSQNPGSTSSSITV